MKKSLISLAFMALALGAQAKTLVAYYSYTNNVERIINELKAQIQADVIEIEPAQKGLDYNANNYALGAQQINAIRSNPTSASSYPAIDPITVNWDEYDVVIIATPLWHSQMAAPMQTFLFQNGAALAGMSIGLIVSSASTGISNVVADAKRLVPNGNFLNPDLWIRGSRISGAKSLFASWLNDIHYNDLTTSVGSLPVEPKTYRVYDINGRNLQSGASSLESLDPGVYIINGQKVLIR